METNGGTRARNEKSLLETLEEVLKAGKPMKVGDIVDAIERVAMRATTGREPLGSSAELARAPIPRRIS